MQEKFAKEEKSATAYQVTDTEKSPCKMRNERDFAQTVKKNYYTQECYVLD